MLRQVAYNIVAVMECVVCTLIKVCFRQAQPRLHVQVTGGALAPRDTHLRHQVIVWPGQGRRGVCQSDCLIHSSHICLPLSTLVAPTLTTSSHSRMAAFVSNTFVMQMTSGS